MYFLLEAKRFNDNEYLLIKMTDLTISQIKHLVKLASALINKATYYTQSIGLTK
jgi:hypothetical protein